MIVEIDHTSAVPPYEQLRDQIARMVLSGVLVPGAQPPTIRQIAADLGLAPGTVARAYRELERERLVVSHRRRGTVVAGPAGQADPARDEQVAAAARRYAALSAQLGLDAAAALEHVREALSQLRSTTQPVGSSEPEAARWTGPRPLGSEEGTVSRLEAMRLGAEPDVTAPDGSEVRILLGLAGGGMAHFQLAPGETTVAVRHRTVEEIWLVVGGAGEMWRRLDQEERTDDLAPGVCLTIPLGTTFQFRSLGPAPLQILGVTMPPWPGSDEAIPSEGPWEPTVGPGE